MSESEFSDLVGLYGSAQVKWMINKLSNYKLANGKQYDSDYNAILSWVVEAFKRENICSRQNREALDKQQRDAEFAEFVMESLTKVE